MDEILWEPIPPADIIGLLRCYEEDYIRAGNGFSANLMKAAADEIELLRAALSELNK